MSIRFNIGDHHIRNFDNVVEWMNQNIGLIEEDKTWFWDTEVYKEWCKNSEQMVERHREGIRIWRDCPAVSLAIWKWS